MDFPEFDEVTLEEEEPREEDEEEEALLPPQPPELQERRELRFKHVEEWEEIIEFLAEETQLEPIIVNVNEEPLSEEEEEEEETGDEGEEEERAPAPVERDEEAIRCDALKQLKSKGALCCI